MALHTYANKDGYRIRATKKAYEMYYKSQGFYLCSEIEDHSTGGTDREDATDSTSEAGFDAMKTADLKVYLEEKGIEYDSRARKEELVKLAEQAADRGRGIEETATEDSAASAQ